MAILDVLEYAMLLTAVLCLLAFAYLFAGAFKPVANTTGNPRENGRPFDPANNDNDFTWLTNEIAREQEYYWSRFYAFATLQTGFLVLVASTVVKRPLVLALLAFILGVVWIYVQFASRFYVNRLKATFYAACGARGIEHPAHWLYKRNRSSTDVALVVPVSLTLFWISFPFVADWFTKP